MKSSVFALALLLISFAANGNSVQTFITVYSMETQSTLEGAVITVYSGRTLIETTHTDLLGEASLQLNFNEVYKIKVDYEGKVGKNIIVDTNVPEGVESELSETIDAHFYLFDRDNLRYDHLEHPMGRFKYDRKRKGIYHDEKYTKRRKHSNAILRRSKGG